MNVHELIERNRNGESIGLPSFCTANQHVLEATLGFAAENELPVLIEATCNQVNQEGGYTGMKPADFASWVARMASHAGVKTDQLLLGGDHLGPNPWRDEPVAVAMRKAEMLVRSYVEAGFQKIHLDASMACDGEPRPSFSDIAQRAAHLCRIAEDYAPDPSKLIYVIGSEVPVPGGETDDMQDLQITTPERLDETVQTHEAAFRKEGLERAWERVVSVVTQPGVDFSHSSVHEFDPAAAVDLVAAIDRHPRLTFEGHSTDYQPTSSLAQLVERHVFFLKVGPELTFRFREAVFALAAIEDRVCPKTVSGIIGVLDEAMDNAPAHWDGYYAGTPADIALQRHFSFSDRIRYYWQEAPVRDAVDQLLNNLVAANVPNGLVTQVFGGLEFDETSGDIRTLLDTHVSKAVSRYYAACGFGFAPSSNRKPMR